MLMVVFKFYGKLKRVEKDKERQMNKQLRLVSILLVVVLASACSIGPWQPGTEPPPNAETQQAQIEDAVRGTATTSAMLTQISQMETQVAAPTAGPGQTVVVETVMVTVILPSQTPTITPSPTPTATQVPATATVTPTVPTATPTQVPPTATPTVTNTPAIPCNQAKFETDVTIPDGTVFSPGVTFTKTWRLRNTGTCTWTTGYDLVFVSGSQFGAPAAVDFPGNVAPGQVIDLSVTLTAPAGDGSYRGYWKLRDASGVLFGLGATNAAFYVDIKVSTSSSKFPLEFAAVYCTAEWTSGSNTLPCPGTANDSRGYVLRIDRPTLESGYVDDEPVLLTHPQMITDSVIRGKFPPIRVNTGYKFSAVIGCAHKATNCDVKFQLDYQVGNGAITTLATWHEVYDEMFRAVSVDLSSLAGQDVKFILTVLANGPSNQDQAQWLAPVISR